MASLTASSDTTELILQFPPGAEKHIQQHFELNGFKANLLHLNMVRPDIAQATVTPSYIAEDIVSKLNGSMIVGQFQLCVMPERKLTEKVSNPVFEEQGRNIHEISGPPPSIHPQPLRPPGSTQHWPPQESIQRPYCGFEGAYGQPPYPAYHTQCQHHAFVYPTPAPYYHPGQLRGGHLLPVPCHTIYLQPGPQNIHSGPQLYPNHPRPPMYPQRIPRPLAPSEHVSI